MKTVIKLPPLPAILHALALAAGLVATALPGFASAAQSAAENGTPNRAFESGDFKKAAELYQEKIKASGPNASLLYNLGNSYFRLGDFGHAIHAYEQALVITPNAADIQTNLKLARDEIASFDPGEAKALEKWTHALSLNQWAKLALTALLAIAAIVLLRTFSAKLDGWRWLRLTQTAAVLVLISGVAILILRKDETARAIVLAPETPVRLSPFATADVVRTLAPGRSVQLGESRGDFVHIGDGWVDRHAIAPIYRRDHES